MNKRASISTFIFVMMVLVTCIYTVWSFSKQVQESGEELIDVSIGMESKVMQEKTNIYLKLISEKAAVLAFNESYYKFSYLQAFEEEGMNREIRRVGFFDSNEYSSFFLEKFKENFIKIIENYPSEVLDENLKNSFKKANFYFDGKNFGVFVKDHYQNYSNGDVTLNSSFSINHNNSLSKLGLPNLSKLSDINVACNDKDRYVECLDEHLPELRFYSNNGDKVLIYKTRYLDKDVSVRYKLTIYKTKKSYYLEGEKVFEFEFNILDLSSQQTDSNYQIIPDNYLSFQNGVPNQVSSK